jgi:acyl-CoA synthetase (AMP-forming)/AMP-acid ligase II
MPAPKIAAPMNVAAAVLAAQLEHPRDIAIEEPSGRSITRGDLHRRIIAWARHLDRAGLAPDDRVLVQVPNGIELSASVLGAMLLGATPVLCEPGLGPAVYRDRVRAADPAWLLVTPLVELVKRTPAFGAMLARLGIAVPPRVSNEGRMGRVFVLPGRLGVALGRARAGSAAAELVRLPDHDAMIAFTGGTTTEPKGVRFSHQALDAYFTNLSHLIGAHSEGPVRAIMADTPAQVFHALRYGATAYLAKGAPSRRARRFLRLIRQRKVDAYFGSPYIWKEMMRLEAAQRLPLPDSLRLVLLGSSPVTRTFLADLTGWAHPSTRIVCLYGLTEAGPVSVVSARDKLAFDEAGDLVGEPIANVTVSLSPAKADDQHGEIVVGGPSLYTGYLGRPERADGEGLRTGDIGRWVDHRGRRMLVLMGRAKDMIIRHAVNIYPATIEPSLRELSDERGRRLFSDCALVGRWNEARQDEDVVLCYEPGEAASSADRALVKARVERALGAEVRPDFYLPLRRLPVTGRQSKVDKNALRTLAADAYR